MEEKRCSKCKQIKPIIEFSRNRTMKKDGYNYICKSCFKVFFKTHQKKSTYKAEHKLKQHKYATKNKDKIYAHNLANRKLKKKSFCESCGFEEGLEKHHPDYSIPDMIKTLCRICHKREHGYVI